MAGEEHQNLIGEHKEKFKNIEGDIDILFAKDAKNELHRIESVEYRTKMAIMWDFRTEVRGWGIGIICSVLVSSVILIFWFGGRMGILERLEKMHPVLVMAAEK
jgi:hypothetical protein